MIVVKHFKYHSADHIIVGKQMVITILSVITLKAQVKVNEDENRLWLNYF